MGYPESGPEARARVVVVVAGGDGTGYEVIHDGREQYEVEAGMHTDSVTAARGETRRLQKPLQTLGRGVLDRATGLVAVRSWHGPLSTVTAERKGARDGEPSACQRPVIAPVALVGSRPLETDCMAC
ncbi:hypothetical protein O9K51_05431 [Purpureocillium lavendulum]|uniref:Uncharacterized protein n=1 Tax=Purpureocillium lavendulum TaxID=1247861 RepID=A0AB34FRL5_9HYPO|nr:hypothetical protein O9K51_05431 [Purpureocillium lavendulum]